MAVDVEGKRVQQGENVAQSEGSGEKDDLGKCAIRQKPCTLCGGCNQVRMGQAGAGRHAKGAGQVGLPSRRQKPWSWKNRGADTGEQDEASGQSRARTLAKCLTWSCLHGKSAKRGKLGK